MSSKAIAAIVLCAGKGTRMKSSRAKVLHEVLGRPIGYYPIRGAIASSANPVVAVVGHQAEEVRCALGDAIESKRLVFSIQSEQLGTAHAVLSAYEELKDFDGEILILYGDTPLISAQTLQALAKAKHSHKATVALVTAVPTNPKGYGRIIREDGKVQSIIEDKDCSTSERSIAEINAGLYLVDADFLWSALKKVDSQNSQKELYLTDLVALAVSEGRPVAAVVAPFQEVAGVNDRFDLARAVSAMRQRINENHMRAGVTIDDPSNTSIDDSVRIGQDTKIGTGTVITGNTVIGKFVHIGVGCVIDSSTIGDGAVLRPYSVLEEAKVGANAQIGPFARLRPGTELEEKVHIGNFVETKKAKIGKGSKANHLTYLGDCEIGTGVNVGAGTITCNYDGVNKHKTVLGDNVFVGSDSQFVAPVTVGDGAYIGAGSTITENVPADSLAIARGRQVNKLDYVKKRRSKSA